jgi:hypothetical protein
MPWLIAGALLGFLAAMFARSLVGIIACLCAGLCVGLLLELVVRGKWRWVLLALPLMTVIGFVGGRLYVRSHPLVFNESFWMHAHCIPQAILELLSYADRHNGTFPYHPDGYGDALLLVEQNCVYALTGPGYDETPFVEAKQEGKHLPEEECGRVYIQGLTTKLKAGQSKIVILFDKLPTPGGDHCHGFSRLTAPLGREVGYADGRHEFVREEGWPEFAKEQIELLVGEGIEREEAERLYASKAKQ